MPLLSVLTATHDGRAELLAEAGRSVAAQELPQGWELEWLVQEDGPAEAPDTGLPSGHQANGAPLGIAPTRNLALARAAGELVHVLDSDDLLLPGALAVAIKAFARHPRIHWVAAQADDLLPGGTRVPYAMRLPPGLIEPGEISAFLATHGQAPIHCAGLTMRTATLRALGGWVGNPRAEDVALLAALAELTPGYLTPEVTWLHRKHSAQTTRRADWATLGEVSLTMIHQRLVALREIGLRLPGCMP